MRTQKVKRRQVMSRVTMIQHINIQISDKARSRDWYENVLGAEYLDRGPN